MPNMKRHYEDGLAYFVTTVTGERKPLFVDRKLCRIMLITLAYFKTIFDYEVYGYCVMPDHLHAIIRPNSEYNLSFIMKMVKGSFARKVNRLAGSSGSMWQPGFYEEAIRSNTQLNNQLNYIHGNPVKADLALTMEKYEFSSYRQYFIPEEKGEVILEVDRPE